jgi:hypothetical protein
MKQIGELLERFKTLKIAHSDVKVAVRETLYSLLSIDVDEASIRVSGDVVFVQVRPIVKNQILLQKETILEELKKTLGQKAPRDVK